MNKIACAILAIMLPLASFGLDARVSKETFDIDADGISAYKAFNWTWSGVDNQRMDITVTNAGGFTLDGSVIMRMTYPKSGPVYKEVSGFAQNTSNAVVEISGANLPPVRTYYAEFIDQKVSGVTTQYRSLAKGRIDVTYSLWLEEDYSASTNLITAPIYPESMKVVTYDTDDNGIVDTSDDFITYTNTFADSEYTNTIFAGTNITLTGGNVSGVNTVAVSAAFASRVDAGIATNASLLGTVSSLGNTNVSMQSQIDSNEYDITTLNLATNGSLARIVANEGDIDLLEGETNKFLYLDGRYAMSGPLTNIYAAGPQLRLAYDAANYADFTASAGGNMTIDPTGTDLQCNSDVMNINGVGGASLVLTDFTASKTTTLKQYGSDGVFEIARSNTGGSDDFTLDKNGDFVIGGYGTVTLKGPVTNASTTRMVGDVLVGATATTLGNLHVNGNPYGELNVQANGTGAFGFGAFSRDNIQFSFDGTYNGATIAATDDTYARFLKTNNKLSLQYTNGLSVGQSFVHGIYKGWTLDLANGEMGIGTDSPDAKLDVSGSGHFSTTLTIDGETTLGTNLTFKGEQIDFTLPDTTIMNAGDLTIKGDSSDDALQLLGGTGSGLGNVGGYLNCNVGGEGLVFGLDQDKYLAFKINLGTIATKLLGSGDWDYYDHAQSNVSHTVYTGAAGTNMFVEHLLIGGTNYMGIWMDGGSTTTLYPVAVSP